MTIMIEYSTRKARKMIKLTSEQVKQLEDLDWVTCDGLNYRAAIEKFRFTLIRASKADGADTWGLYIDNEQPGIHGNDVCLLGERVDLLFRLKKGNEVAEKQAVLDEALEDLSRLKQTEGEAGE